MNNSIFRISKKKYNGKTSVVSARLPDTLITDIDKICELTGRNRNDIIEKCLVFAMENLEINNSMEDN